MTAIAHCLSANFPVSVTIVSSNTAGNGPANDTPSFTAACPSGSVVTGGGYQASGRYIINGSQPYNDGWQVSAYQPFSITAYAICATGHLAPATIHSATATIPAMPNDAPPYLPVTFHVAGCPSGQLLTGGGMANGPNAMVQIHFSWSSSASNLSEWTATAINSFAGKALPAVAYAVCVKIVP